VNPLEGKSGGEVLPRGGKIDGQEGTRIPVGPSSSRKQLVCRMMSQALPLVEEVHPWCDGFLHKNVRETSVKEAQVARARGLGDNRSKHQQGSKAYMGKG